MFAFHASNPNAPDATPESIFIGLMMFVVAYVIYKLFGG
jgi:hypothetical protein